MDNAAHSALDLLQDRLVRRRLQLLAEIHVALAAGRLPAAAGEVADWKDEALRLQQAEVAGAEERRDEDELARVEQALLRLRHGTYGRCMSCGQPIAWQRLQAQPEASHCIACQSRLEQHPAALRAA
jgi:DnaK suppressor protein